MYYQIQISRFYQTMSIPKDRLGQKRLSRAIYAEYFYLPPKLRNYIRYSKYQRHNPKSVRVGKNDKGGGYSLLSCLYTCDIFSLIHHYHCMCGINRKTPFRFLWFTHETKTFTWQVLLTPPLTGWVAGSTVFDSTQVRSYRLSNAEMPAGTRSAYGFRDCRDEGRCWRIACKLSVWPSR